METTADWHDWPVETRSTTSRRSIGGSTWGTRKVRKDGSVRFHARRYIPDADVVLRPIPGEWLFFFHYGTIGYSEECPSPLYEWTAPADPDGYLRRTFWRVADGR
jgi:hypothetical protein